MPSATVPMCRAAMSMSRRSSTIVSPVVKTLWNLPACFERATGQRDAACSASQLELQHPFVAGEHDETALRAGNLDRRVEHQREHVIEHSSRSECAQSLEQARHVAKLSGHRDRAALVRVVVS